LGDAPQLSLLAKSVVLCLARRE
ncbi:MAG: hypothetical protein RIR25_907, partial [Verrucomicrobiota bacterium]